MTGLPLLVIGAVAAMSVIAAFVADTLVDHFGAAATVPADVPPAAPTDGRPGPAAHGGLDAARPVAVIHDNPPPRTLVSGSRVRTATLVAATALVVSLAARFTVGGALFWCVPVLSSIAGALFIIDMREMRLPGPLTDALLAVTAASLASVGAVDGSWPLLRSVLSGLLWTSLIGGLWLFSRGRAMGMGDVCLVPSLGLLLGWASWGASFVGLLAAFALGAVVGVAAKVANPTHPSRIPFGPFLIAGCVVGLCLGGWVSSAYLSIAGLS